MSVQEKSTQDSETLDFAITPDTVTGDALGCLEKQGFSCVTITHTEPWDGGTASCLEQLDFLIASILNNILCDGGTASCLEQLDFMSASVLNNILWDGGTASCLEQLDFLSASILNNILWDGGTASCLEQLDFLSASIFNNILWDGGTANCHEQLDFQSASIFNDKLWDGGTTGGLENRRFPCAPSSQTVSQGGRTLDRLQHDLISWLRKLLVEVASWRQPVFIRDRPFVQVGIGNTTNKSCRVVSYDTRHSPFTAIPEIFSTLEALEAIVSIQWEPGALGLQCLQNTLTLMARHLLEVQAVPMGQVYILQNCDCIQIGVGNRMVFAEDGAPNLVPHVSSTHNNSYRTCEVDLPPRSSTRSYSNHSNISLTPAIDLHPRSSTLPNSRIKTDLTPDIDLHPRSSTLPNSHIKTDLTPDIDLHPRSSTLPNSHIKTDLIPDIDLHPRSSTLPNSHIKTDLTPDIDLHSRSSTLPYNHSNEYSTPSLLHNKLHEPGNGAKFGVHRNDIQDLLRLIRQLCRLLQDRVENGSTGSQHAEVWYRNCAHVQIGYDHVMPITEATPGP